MKTILLVAAALAASFGAAAAADLPYKAPPPPPRAVSWTGCFIGAGGGYGMWNQDHTTLDVGVPVTAQATAVAEVGSAPRRPAATINGIRTGWLELSSTAIGVASAAT